MSGAEGTLGLFSIGIPVLFLRSDLLARMDEDVWSYPDPEHVPPSLHRFRDPATIRHELRHFHDCLLTPFLFRRFILEIQRNYISARMIAAAQAGGTTIEDIVPDPESKALLEAHLSAEREYEATYAHVREPRKFRPLGIDITVSNLLEASAILVEVQHVAEAGGPEAARAYWNQLKGRLSEEYTKLMCLAENENGLSLEAVFNLHHLIVFSLYCGSNPAQVFEDRLSSAGNRPPRFSSDQIGHLLETIEANFTTETFSFIGLEDEYVGSEFMDPQVASALRQAKDYFIFPSEVIRARRDLLTAFAGQAFDLVRYVVDSQGFPAPPTCFFPDDEMMLRNVLPFARKEDLRSAYGDIYSIASKRDATRRTTISVGLIPTPGFMSFVALNKVDTMLATRYLAQRLFSEHVTYNAELDRAYKQIARTVAS